MRFSKLLRMAKGRIFRSSRHLFPYNRFKSPSYRIGKLNKWIESLQIQRTSDFDALTLDAIRYLPTNSLRGTFEQEPDGQETAAMLFEEYVPADNFQIQPNDFVMIYRYDYKPADHKTFLGHGAVLKCNEQGFCHVLQFRIDIINGKRWAEDTGYKYHKSELLRLPSRVRELLKIKNMKIDEIITRLESETGTTLSEEQKNDVTGLLEEHQSGKKVDVLAYLEKEVAKKKEQKQSEKQTENRKIPISKLNEQMLNPGSASESARVGDA